MFTMITEIKLGTQIGSEFGCVLIKKNADISFLLDVKNKAKCENTINVRLKSCRHVNLEHLQLLIVVN